jgi:pre-mRNA-splicing factor CDC5/CEF1
LSAASSLLEGEVTYVIKAMDHSNMSSDTYLETWHNVNKDLIWLPSKGRYERAASATNTERIESIKVADMYKVS